MSVGIHLPARRSKTPRSEVSHESELDAIFSIPAIAPHLLDAPQSALLLQHTESLDTAKLCEASSVPVIQPHYRLGPDHSYPTPIHDVAVAYEGAIQWLETNLKSSRSPPRDGADTVQARQIQIGMTGDLIGGSLALALGLTECRKTGPARVVAVSVQEPILDWVFENDTRLQRDVIAQTINGSLDHDADGETSPQDEIDAFHSLRHVSFPGRRPHRYFDPFASPLHFLRSPSGRLPNSQLGASGGDGMLGPQFQDIDEDAQDGDELEDEGLARTVGALVLSSGPPSLNPSSNLRKGNNFPASPETSPASSPVRRPMDPNDPRRFKRPLRYPSADHARHLLLPRIHISTHSQSLLKPQAEEFVRLLRRGLLRDKGFKMSKTVEKLLANEALLDAELAKQPDDMIDERLELARQGFDQFQLKTTDEKQGNTVAGLTAWLMAR